MILGGSVLADDPHRIRPKSLSVIQFLMFYQLGIVSYSVGGVVGAAITAL
jgi:hypothetical protein